jgi:enoyl-CoA hydratase/carnithine racemase
MAATALTWEVEAGVATVTIDHPPSNLVDGEFIGGLLSLLASVEDDPKVRVLLFRSADPDFFLMHGDAAMIAAIPASEYVPQTEPNIAAATFDRLSRGPLVSIGLLGAAARGGGCEFLSAMDIRVGSQRAVVGQPEVAMAILPGAGGTARWPRLVGRGRALELILTGRDIGAEEAYAIGWLDVLVAHDELDLEGLRLARRIAAMPAGSVTAVKRVVDVSLGSIGPALVAENDALTRRLADGEHREAIGRFLAAGGQTRDGERERMTEIVDATIEPG